MKEEKYTCSDVDCDYTSCEGGECPQCGAQLDKVRGEAYFSQEDETGDNMAVGPMLDSDDPDEVSWYSDEPAGI